MKRYFLFVGCVYIMYLILFRGMMMACASLISEIATMRSYFVHTFEDYIVAKIQFVLQVSTYTRTYMHTLNVYINCSLIVINTNRVANIVLYSGIAIKLSRYTSVIYNIL